MQNVPLSQDELKLTCGILANVSLKPVDGALVFDLIKKLDSFIDKTEKPKTDGPIPDGTVSS